MSSEHLSDDGQSVEYRPTVDAHYLALSDRRVEFAMNEENAFWNWPEPRIRVIIERCKRAGYR